MQIDTTINTFMQSIQNPTLTLFSKSIAVIFDPIFLVIVSMAIAGFLYYKNKKKESVVILSSIIITGIIVEFLKNTIHRVRPTNMLVPETGFSFPSGHATMTIVFLGLLTYIFTKSKSKKTKILSLLVSSLIIIIVALSRICLEVHWATDVIGGLVIGGAILIVSILTYKNL